MEPYLNIQGKKILILYTSVGLGHKSIAENIGYWLHKAGAEVRLEDILQVQKGKLVNVTAWLHGLINRRMPFIWSWLYKSKWFTDHSLKFRTKVAGNNYHRTLELVNEFHPDVVVTTQTTASAILAFLKQRGLFNGLFGITFSDFHLHRYWLYDEADFYIANISEQKEEMVALGVAKEKIFVCGMTLKPQINVDVNGVRAQLGVAEGERVVLVSSGSLGIGLSDEVIAELLEIPLAKIIVVCGKNETAARHLREVFQNYKNLIALGFYQPMEELYAIANIFISKPGGLSTAEALRSTLPMLVTYVLPGQEELNYDYLQSKGLIMPEPVAVAETVAEELESRSFKESLVQNQTVREIVSSPEVLLKSFNAACEK